VDVLTPELRALLRAVGLGEKEITTYLILVEEGPMTARELSDRLGVPYTKTYAYLRRLEVLGAVERIGSRPAIYAARPPREVITRLIAAANRLVNQLEQVATTLQAVYEARYGTVGSNTFVTVLRGAEVIRRAMAMILGSDSVYVAIAHNAMTQLVEAISEASKRARIRVLLRKGIEIDLPPRVEVRVREVLFGSGVIGDEALLVVEIGGVLTAMYTGDRFLVDVARTYFEYLFYAVE